MKYTCCQNLQSGLHFNFKDLRCCCSIQKGHAFIEDYKGKKINWKKLKEERKKIIEDCKQGIFPQGCIGCPELKEQDWDDSYKIDQLYLFHWTHCNCGCIYCVNMRNTKGQYVSKPQKSAYYNLLPVIKDMIWKKELSKRANVFCLGGESGVLKEFDPIMDSLLKNGTNQIIFLTSGISYIKSIEKALKQTVSEIIISIDAGCKETYKLIKRVDEFDSVVKNVVKYASSTSSAAESITLKYIIVENKNDTTEEIEKWLMLTKNLGLNRVRLDLDYSKILQGTEDTVPKHFYALFEYFKNRTDELKFKRSSFEFINELLEKSKNSYTE